MRDIAKNIRTLRTIKKLTQDELAEKLFVTRQTVSNYETGKSRPDVDTLVNVASALDTDVNTLIYGAPADEGKRRWWRIAAAVVIPVVLLILSSVLLKKGKMIAAYTFDTTLNYICICLLRPLGLFAS